MKTFKPTVGELIKELLKFPAETKITFGKPNEIYYNFQYTPTEKIINIGKCSDNIGYISF